MKFSLLAAPLLASVALAATASTLDSASLESVASAAYATAGDAGLDSVEASALNDVFTAHPGLGSVYSSMRGVYATGGTAALAAMSTDPAVLSLESAYPELVSGATSTAAPTATGSAPTAAPSSSSSAAPAAAKVGGFIVALAGVAAGAVLAF